MYTFIQASKVAANKWVHRKLCRRVRRVLAACVSHLIRTRFPALAGEQHEAYITPLWKTDYNKPRVSRAASTSSLAALGTCVSITATPAIIVIGGSVTFPITTSIMWIINVGRWLCQTTCVLLRNPQFVRSFLLKTSVLCLLP